VSASALLPRVGSHADRGLVSDAGWLEWLSAHIDTAVAAR
jgi:hypothetical protein